MTSMTTTGQQQQNNDENSGNCNKKRMMWTFSPPDLSSHPPTEPSICAALDDVPIQRCSLRLSSYDDEKYEENDLHFHIIVVLSHCYAVLVTSITIIFRYSRSSSYLFLYIVKLSLFSLSWSITITLHCACNYKRPTWAQESQGSSNLVARFAVGRCQSHCTVLVDGIFFPMFRSDHGIEADYDIALDVVDEEPI